MTPPRRPKEYREDPEDTTEDTATEDTTEDTPPAPPEGNQSERAGRVNPDA